MKILFTALQLSLLLVFPLNAEILVKDASAITSMPTSKSGAIFMTIHNNGENVDRLLSATTGVSKMSQLHTLEMDGDVMKMVHVKQGFEVPAYGHLSLEQGGKHIMLMGLRQTLEKNSFFELILKFENAGDVEVKVLYQGSGMKMDHSHDD